MKDKNAKVLWINRGQPMKTSLFSTGCPPLTHNVYLDYYRFF
jgi:hypothetical protein